VSVGYRAELRHLLAVRNHRNPRVVSKATLALIARRCTRWRALSPIRQIP
jgi:hypothetical protein